MATKVLDVPEGHYRSVTVTTLTALAGVGAAFVSAALTGDAATPAEAATDNLGLYVLVAFMFVQYPLYAALGIDLGEFSTKDHLYVAFMTFSMWFVVWTILLTSGVSL